MPSVLKTGTGGFLDAKKKYRLCAEAAEEKHAENLVVLDVAEVTDFTQYFIIASGASDRQVQAIADSIQEKMKEHKILPVGIEGYNEGKWILMDYDDVIIHVFYGPIRELYDLERLWHDAKKVRRRKAAKTAANKTA